MTLLTRVQVLGAVRVGALHAMSVRAATIPEAEAFAAAARRKARTLPNGPSIRIEGRLVLEQDGDGQ